MVVEENKKLIDALHAAYQYINASEDELKESGLTRHYWVSKFHELYPKALKQTGLTDCPFCGVTPLIFTGKYDKYSMTTISCENDDCAMVVSIDLTGDDPEQEAIEKWNRRVI